MKRIIIAGESDKVRYLREHGPRSREDFAVLADANKELSPDYLAGLTNNPKGIVRKPFVRDASVWTVEKASRIRRGSSARFRK